MDSNSTNLLEPQYDLPLNLCLLVVGLGGMVTNTLVMYTIAKSKDLHNKSQYVIFSHAVGEFMLALSTVQFGIYGCIAYVAKLAAPTQYTCMYLVMPEYVFGALSIMATAGLGIDRLLAAKFPIFYKQTDNFRYILVFNLIIWGLCIQIIPEASVLTELYSNGTVGICTYITAMSPTFAKVSNVRGGIFSMVTLAVYVIALVTMGYRYWGTKWLNEAQRTEWARKVQFSAFKTIMFLGLLYICFWVLVVVIQMVAASGTLSPGGSIKLMMYGGLLPASNVMTHLFVYLLLNPKFRSGFRQAILRNTKVHVVSAHSCTGRRSMSKI